MPGMVAFPSRPWQRPHDSAFCCPAWRSAADAGAPAVAARTATTAHRRKGERDAPLSIPRTATEAGTRIVSALVGDPIDRPRIVIRHQERAVAHLLHVHRPAPDLVTLEPALGEHLVLGHVSGAESHHHDPEADLLGAVPGAALGEERAVLVLCRKHRARVEVDTVAGHVRSRLEEGRRELAAAAPLAVLRIGDVALVAVWVPEVQALPWRVVEPVARHVLTQPVAPVGGEVQFLRHRMPVEAHAVSDTVGVVLEPGAVG